MLSILFSHLLLQIMLVLTIPIKIASESSALSVQRETGEKGTLVTLKPN